jgi:Domain of unknown function (DUF4864)
MNSGGKTVRWSKVLLLGCALGLLFVLIDLSVLNFLRQAGLADGGAQDAGFRLSDPPVKEELTRVISSQLAAFRKGDYAGAYDFAALGLRTRVSPAAFEQMMKDGYPLIAQSRDASFGVMLDNGTRAVVSVGIRSASGRMAHYQYLLTREPAGWKISGVTRITLRGTTV